MSSQAISGNFRAEKDLVDYLAAAAGGLLGSFPATSVRREVELGRRIADLVACGFEEWPCWSSLAPFRRSSVLDLALLAHLLQRPLTAKTLARRTRIARPEVSRRLDRLTEWGLADRSLTGAYSAAGWGRWLPEEVVAFEAKLFDWRTAIEQAAYYSTFTDRAWVVMPETEANNPELRRECRTSGVGLISVGAAGTDPVVLPRRQKGNRIHRRLFRLRILWALLDQPSDA